MLHPGSYLPGGAGFYSVRPQAQGKAGVAAGRLKWMADHQALQFVGDLNYDGSDAEPIDIGVANEFVELQRGRIDLHNVRCLRRAQSLPGQRQAAYRPGPGVHYIAFDPMGRPICRSAKKRKSGLLWRDPGVGQVALSSGGSVGRVSRALRMRISRKVCCKAVGRQLVRVAIP